MTEPTPDPRTEPSTLPPNGLDLLRRLVGAAPSDGLGALLGLRIEAVEDGQAVVSLTTGAQHVNPHGALHGGVVSTLLDAAMGAAVHTTLPAGVGLTTVDLHVTFLRPGPVDGSSVRAEGTVLHRGRRVATARGTLHDAGGRLLATGTATCQVLPG